MSYKAWSEPSDLECGSVASKISHVAFFLHISAQPAAWQPRGQTGLLAIGPLLQKLPWVPGRGARGPAWTGPICVYEVKRQCRCVRPKIHGILPSIT